MMLKHWLDLEYKKIAESKNVSDRLLPWRKLENSERLVFASLQVEEQLRRVQQEKVMR